MKSIEEIKAALPPKTKFFFPNDFSGITRFKLKSTKHRCLIHVVFTASDSGDVVTASYRQVFVTPEEMEELKVLFFQPEEHDSCVVVDDPRSKYSKILCCIRDGVSDGT